MEPLSIRRRDLLARYYLKVKSDHEHPCYHIMDLDAYELYEYLSDRYLRRLSGLPVSLRLRIYIPVKRLLGEERASERVSPARAEG